MTVRPANLEKVIRLEKAGYFPAPGENEQAFFDRVEKTSAVFEEFAGELQNGSAEFDSVRVKPEEQIPDSFVREAGDVTEQLYGFRISHVPGFFLTGGVGLLWGGCMIGDCDSGFSLFLIRNAFRNRSRYLIYDRRELFAHELCHAARMPLGDNPRFEEHFAYQTSGSSLRRGWGNCFIHSYDALLFVAGSLLLPIGQCLQLFLLPQLPIAPFWVLAFAYPLFLIIRNLCARRVLRKAECFLKQKGFSQPHFVLFRSTDSEIAELAKGNFPDSLNDLRLASLRFSAEEPAEKGGCCEQPQEGDLCPPHNDKSSDCQQ